MEVTKSTKLIKKPVEKHYGYYPMCIILYNCLNKIAQSFCFSSFSLQTMKMI